MISPGLNHWTFSPILNATYISDSGFEVSSSFEADINTRNHATDYKNGVEYRHEFAVGQHVGPWTVGVGGYYYRQFTDDDAPGLEAGNRARVLAVGPAVSYFKPGIPGVAACLQGARCAKPRRGLHRGAAYFSQFLKGLAMNQSSSVSAAASPSRQASWREGLVLMLGSSLTIMGSVMVAPILPRLGAEFGPMEPRADLLVPLAVTGPALTIALCAPLAGWLADRVGRKALLVIATVLYALLGALPALLDGLPSIVGARLLFGCTEAAVMTCCATLIADYWQGEERLRYVNRQVVTIGLVGALFSWWAVHSASTRGARRSSCTYCPCCWCRP